MHRRQTRLDAGHVCRTRCVRILMNMLCNIVKWCHVARRPKQEKSITRRRPKQKSSITRRRPKQEKSITRRRRRCSPSVPTSTPCPAVPSLSTSHCQAAGAALCAHVCMYVCMCACTRVRMRLRILVCKRMHACGMCTRTGTRVRARLVASYCQREQADPWGSMHTLTYHLRSETHVAGVLQIPIFEKSTKRCKIVFL